MVEYGIVTSNKFHFLSDDEGADPSEILEKAAQIKKIKGTSTTKVPQSTAPTSTNFPKPEKQAPTEIANKENATATRGGRGRGRGARDGGNRENRREEKREGQQEEKLEGGERRFDGERRGRGRGRGNFTGERRERPNDGERRVGGEHRGDGERRGDGEKRFGERRGRGGRGAFEGGERRLRPDNDVALFEAGDDKTEDRRGRRGGGYGGNRGSRGGAPRHDRTSGSDRTGPRGGTDKKEGHGKGNWGTEQDELQGETEPIVEATDIEKQAAAQEEDAGDKNDSGVEVEKEEEKQPVGITFNEWKEKNKAAEIEAFNVRKPNDDKKLNLAPLKKSDDTDKDTDEFVVLRREPREKHVDISVNFASADRGFSGNRGGGRGDRDGFRGRGRGGDRGGSDRSGDRDRRTRGGSNQFSLASEQFPALGGR